MMDAYIASVPVHLLTALQMIKQKNIKKCDLYYVPTSNNADELLEAVRSTKVFHSVTMLPNINIEYPITVRQCINIALNRFGAGRELKGKHYDTVYYNTDGWLLNSIVFSSLQNKKARNIFVENGINPYITPYDTKAWYLRLFINLNMMTCMDGRYIDDRYVYEPSLICVPQSGEIHKINKLDRNDDILKKQVNTIFGYDEKEDSFAQKDIIIMEQGPRKEPINMHALWGRVSRYVNKERTVVKSHPRQKESILKDIGFDMYERYTIPWEVLTFNKNMSEKTMLSIFSTSCTTPKLMFDEEPRVIMLYKLIGIDYSFFGKGLIEFVEGIGKLYREKDKFFIPETWDELEEYCSRHGLTGDIN